MDMDSSYEMMTGCVDFDIAPLQDVASETALLTALHYSLWAMALSPIMRQLLGLPLVEASWCLCI